MKNVVALVAVVLTVACSSSTAPDNRPTWADGSWKGTVTMQSGTTLNIAFQLRSVVGRNQYGSADIWFVEMVAPRVENVLAGKSTETVSGGWDDRFKSFNVGFTPESVSEPAPA